MNQYLKEMCQIIGFDEMVRVKKSIGGKRVDKFSPKWENVTTHTARRSFATNFFELGIPASQIMLITGHSTEKQFMDYININKKRNALNVAKTVAILMRNKGIN